MQCGTRTFWVREEKKIGNYMKEEKEVNRILTEKTVPIGRRFGGVLEDKMGRGRNVSFSFRMIQN